MNEIAAPVDNWRPEGHHEDLPWPPPEDLPDSYYIPHPSEETKKAFNEIPARQHFGDSFIDELVKTQKRFCGDWYQLAYLIQSHKRPINERVAKEKCQCSYCLAATHGPHLEGANLENAHLEYVHLQDAHLENARLNYAHLNNANLKHAFFDNTSLIGVHLDNAILSHVNFSTGNLTSAERKKNLLTGAHLENAKLEYAHLENSDLTRANLQNADLKGAYFEGAIITESIFDAANVLGAKGIIFDSCRVQRMLIEGDAHDPWSVLRRTYTGPWFFFHVLMLIVFLLPFLVSTVVLSTQSKAIPAIDRFMKTTTMQMERGSKTINEKGFLLPNAAKERWTTTHAKWKDFFQEWENAPRVSAAWVLLGFPRWGYWEFTFFIFTLTMILYNFMRGVLTVQVSMLREAEERSQITPAKHEYYGQRLKPEKPFEDDFDIPFFYLKAFIIYVWKYFLHLTKINLWGVHHFVKGMMYASYFVVGIRVVHWVCTTQVPVF